MTPDPRSSLRPVPRAAAAPPLRRSHPETVPVHGSVPRGLRLARIGVWTALAAGPLALAGVLTVMATPGSTAQAAPTPHTTTSAPSPAVDPAGTAALFVELWLRADSAAPDSPTAAAVHSMAPAADLPTRSRSEAAQPGAVSVVALRTASTRDGWTVLVAALADTPRAALSSPVPASPAADGAPAARYFAVSGTGGTNDGPLTVTGPPAEVAGPASAPAPATPYTRAVPTGQVLATTVGEFLRTYLTSGQGAGVERYLSPGVHLSVPVGGAYVRADVEEVAADTEQAAAKDVPGDGVRTRVRVRVTGEDRAGTRWPLVYRLEMTARAGRWEVSALDTAAPAASPAPSTQAGTR
ncbi:conjugal transfer protein [Streptomyces sp. NBC_00536]|uniref:conjugal transfer protein n=1 Tax=Streptomyces sp. NBC_00536 TaxID=2975769 RepID=UPI002E8143EE|nr:conjugal transfer protein [Streptomyces sp. NBC_00536]WUC83457.1 conjugal transfer protein [Streptomyces sp. NBC_00536]